MADTKATREKKGLGKMQQTWERDIEVALEWVASGDEWTAELERELEREREAESDVL